MQNDIKIDLITHNPEKDACQLIAIAQGPWAAQELEGQLRTLQEKLSAYVDAAVDGFVAKMYPEVSGKSLIIRLDCYGVPRNEVEQFFNQFSEQIRNSSEVQARIARDRHIKDLSFEFSWASIQDAIKASEYKDVSDPTFNAADFMLQVTGGRLRWFAVVCAVLSAGLFIYMLTQGDKAEVNFPIVIQGPAATWTIGGVFIIWAVIGVVNWRNWFKRKKSGA